VLTVYPADLSYLYTHRQCAEYAKLGMMGVTVVYSSGDFGVAGNGGLCLNPDGSQTKDGKVFNREFPSRVPRKLPNNLQLLLLRSLEHVLMSQVSELLRSSQILAFGIPRQLAKRSSSAAV